MRRPEQKTRHVFTCRVFSSGDVLLSHNLSSHYHRGCSVSLPCSEWERVVPLRYYHQSPMPDWQFDASHRKVRDRVSGDKPSKNNRFSDIYIQDPPSLALRHGKSNPTRRLRFINYFRSHSSQFAAPSCDGTG